MALNAAVRLSICTVGNSSSGANSFDITIGGKIALLLNAGVKGQSGN
ncbi:Uncharacterised protein [Salmonella enterica subsp. enterica]|nr:Uncharacterised protein [Salmonella enterica subsp. enterica]